MRMPPLKLRRWSRTEYDRLTATGVFDSDDRLELLDGLMVVKEPQGSWHAATVSQIRRVLQGAFGDRYDVRTHAPIALDDMSGSISALASSTSCTWSSRRSCWAPENIC